MKKSLLFTVVSARLFTGCAIGFGRHGNLVIVPALPMTVEVDSDTYYYHDGYYYRYDGNIWFYSERREGPWLDLPRNRYPREVRYRGREERGHDNRDRDGREHDNRQHN